MIGILYLASHEKGFNQPRNNSAIWGHTLSLGPQFGSLDVDDDGIPDVPIIVLQSSSNQSVQGEGRTKIGLAPASLLLRLSRHHAVKAIIIVEPRASGLDLVIPLRC